jgi:hypothetical protein
MRIPLATALLLVALVAGCGGDGGDEEESPEQRLEALLPEYERAVNEQDCRAFARFAHSAVRPPGRKYDDPPDAQECRNLGTAYTRLEGLTTDRLEVYGSAAIVEGKMDGRVVAQVWLVDVDGRWKQVQSSPPGIAPQIDGTPRPSDRFEANAAAFVEAMRSGDCRTVFRLLNVASPFLESEAEPAGSFCTRFRRSFRAPGRLAAQLEAAPDAKPVDMGGTSDFHFYRLDTGGDRHWTLILNTLPPALPPAGHAQDSILDYYPTGDPEG